MDRERIQHLLNRTLYPHHTACLSAMLEAEDVGMYLDACRDRIGEAGLIDFEDVILDIMNFADVLMTADGLFICRDILTCYCSDEYLDTIYKYITLLDEKAETNNDLLRLSRGFKTRTLIASTFRAWFGKKWQKYLPKNDELDSTSIAKDTKYMLLFELVSRTHINRFRIWIWRKVQRIYSFIRELPGSYYLWRTLRTMERKYKNIEQE